MAFHSRRARAAIPAGALAVLLVVFFAPERPRFGRRSPWVVTIVVPVRLLVILAVVIGAVWWWWG